MANTIDLSGYIVSFERRRYGTQFFTWAYVKLGEESVCLGDPWPCVTPKRDELRAAIDAECERRKLYHIRSALLLWPRDFKPDSFGHRKVSELNLAGQKAVYVLDKARKSAIVLGASYDWQRRMTIAECQSLGIQESDILPGCHADICYEIHQKLAADQLA